MVKIALDSRKLNESCVKKKATMPNMEELNSKLSAKTSRTTEKFGRRRSTWIMHTDRPNYQKKPRDIVYFPYMVSTSPDTIVSTIFSTDCRTFPDRQSTGIQNTIMVRRFSVWVTIISKHWLLLIARFKTKKQSLSKMPWLGLMRIGKLPGTDTPKPYL